MRETSFVQKKKIFFLTRREHHFHETIRNLIKVKFYFGHSPMSSALGGAKPPLPVKFLTGGDDGNGIEAAELFFGHGFNFLSLLDRPAAEDGDRNSGRIVLHHVRLIECTKAEVGKPQTSAHCVFFGGGEEGSFFEHPQCGKETDSSWATKRLVTHAGAQRVGAFRSESALPQSQLVRRNPQIERAQQSHAGVAVGAFHVG